MQFYTVMLDVLLYISAIANGKQCVSLSRILRSKRTNRISWSWGRSDGGWELRCGFPFLLSVAFYLEIDLLKYGEVFIKNRFIKNMEKVMYAEILGFTKRIVYNRMRCHCNLELV